MVSVVGRSLKRNLKTEKHLCDTSTHWCTRKRGKDDPISQRQIILASETSYGCFSTRKEHGLMEIISFEQPYLGSFKGKDRGAERSVPNWGGLHHDESRGLSLVSSCCAQSARRRMGGNGMADLLILALSDLMHVLMRRMVFLSHYTTERTPKAREKT